MINSILLVAWLPIFCSGIPFGNTPRGHVYPFSKILTRFGDETFCGLCIKIFAQMQNITKLIQKH